MTEKLTNTPLVQFEAFEATIRGKQHDMLYDKAADLVVILGYAAGRNLIYRGHVWNKLIQLSEEEIANHPEAKMVLVSNDELASNTPAELFEMVDVEPMEDE